MIHHMPFLGLSSPRLKLMSSWLMGAAVLSFASVAKAEDGNENPQGGPYLNVSGGVADLLSKPAARGSLTAGSMVIPFDATVDYGTGWNGRIAIGYEQRRNPHDERGESNSTSPDFRVEVEYVAVREKRRHFTAGQLSSPLNDNLRADAGFANAYWRLVGDASVRLWAAGGIGYAHVATPDATMNAACSCLGAASGTGLAYQGKLVTEMAVSPSVHVLIDAGAIHFPGLRTAERPVAVTEYGKAWMGTMNLGLRLTL